MRTLWPLALAAAIPASLVACKSDSPPPQHLDVTVSWNDTRQNIEGFGASSAFFGQTITEDVADQLFDAKKGIGLSLLRIMIGVPADTDNSALAAEPETGANPVATSPELYTAQQAYVRGARVWATAWTPPPIWKEHNSKLGSQTDSTVGTVFKTNKLVSSHYGDYANYLADFVDLMAKNSVPLMGVSPANEPDYVASWDGAQWSPDELTTFIGQNMGPTFAKCCASVKIITPDTASWPNVDSYVTPLLADSAAKNYLSVVATHPYQNGSAAIDLNYSKPRDNGKEFWETEWSQENSKGDTPDPTMKSAIDLMNHLHDHLTGANMNAWSWWAAYITANDLRNGDKPKIRQNPALIQPIHPDTDDPPVMFKRGYAFAHWSKFVRPGFLRLGATDHPNPGVLVEAYRDSDSHIALTAINTSGSKVTQKFLVEGGSFGTLTPWVTSADDDLVAKDTIDAGNSFTFDLPAQSVVTFVNWDAKNVTPDQDTLPTINQDGGTPKPSNGGLDCSAAIVPNNLGDGGVTDFSDWGSSKWGSNTGLWGYAYSYAGPTSASTMSYSVDASAKSMSVKGSVIKGEYGGAGISFGVCATATSFSQIQFTLSGSSPGCDLQLQIKTFDQQPVTQTPAGGCFQDAGASCYDFPVAKQVAVPSKDATTVVTPLSSFANGSATSWSSDMAKQVVGMQWQWTTNADLDPDASAGCPIDVKITDIKFLP